MTHAFDPLGHVTHPEDLEALQSLALGCSARQMAYRVRDLAALEVGSWAGSSALVLERLFDQVFCVDTWAGTPTDRLGGLADSYGHGHVFETFCRNMGDRLHRSVFPCVGTSLTWGKVWSRPLDFIFIDADHSYESCASDILAWRKHLARGGTICGHDYSPHFPGVVNAVDTYAPARKLAGKSLWFLETA